MMFSVMNVYLVKAKFDAEDLALSSKVPQSALFAFVRTHRKTDALSAPVPF